MVFTYTGFVKNVVAAVNAVLEVAELFYLEAYETQTERNGQTYKGVMIQSNLKGVPCCSAFYLEDAYQNYKSRKFDMEEFAVDMVKQFLDDFGDEIKEFFNNFANGN